VAEHGRVPHQLHDLTEAMARTGQGGGRNPLGKLDLAHDPDADHSGEKSAHKEDAVVQGVGGAPQPLTSQKPGARGHQALDGQPDAKHLRAPLGRGGLAQEGDKSDVTRRARDEE